MQFQPSSVPGENTLHLAFSLLRPPRLGIKGDGGGAGGGPVGIAAPALGVFAVRARRPQPVLFLDAEAARHRRRLRPDEAVLVAQRAAQRRAKVRVVTAADDAEDALLFLDRGAMQDRSEMRYFGRAVGRHAAGNELVVDAGEPAARDHAGD